MSEIDVSITETTSFIAYVSNINTNEHTNMTDITTYTIPVINYSDNQIVSSVTSSDPYYGTVIYLTTTLGEEVEREDSIIMYYVETSGVSVPSNDAVPLEPLTECTPNSDTVL